MKSQPARHEVLRHARSATLLLLTGLAVLASACSQGDAGASNDPVQTVVTIPASPLPAPTAAGFAPPTTLAQTTTAAPTVPAPTTTLAPTTTEAPTTTAAPTTTVAPTTTMITIPSNVEPVPPFEFPLAAVGTSGGDETRRIQLRLLQLGFWHGGVDGKYGLTTKQAVMAFQKYIGLPASGGVDQVTAAYLSNMTERAHGLTNTGDLIEIDKRRQLLFIVRGGKTLWTLNTSTGNGEPYAEEDQNSPGEIQTGVSITSPGLWDVYRERPEGWWEGDLGEIYRPKYFHGGQAVHGSNSVPNYPASHGCVRVTVPAMDWIWESNWMPLDIVVWVHDE